MVTGESEVHPQTGNDFAIHHHGFLADRSDREDGSLRRIDDGIKGVHPVGPEIRDRDGAIIELAGEKFPFPGSCGEILDLA